MKKYLFLIFTLLTTLVAVSCQDEDFGYTEQDVFKGAYKRNFESTYGKIDPNQSWDLSTYGRTRTSNNGTRALDEIVTLKDGWYEVDNSMIQWIKGKLPEDTNNSDNESFSMIMDGGDFVIVPLFESGNTSLNYELHMVVHNGSSVVKDKTVWTRSTSTDNRNNIEVKSGTAECHTCHGIGIVPSSGTENCLNCGGRGYFPGGTTSCPVPGCNRGTVTATCPNPDCDEQGWDHTVPCSKCGGQGKVWWIFPCLECGGSLGLFGIGAKDGTGYTKCATCDGDHKITYACGVCKDGKVTACTVCNGSGKGGITCSTCSGNGVTDDTAWKPLKKTETTRDARATRTKPTYVSSSEAPAGNVVYFYLETKNKINNYTDKDQKQSSLESKMKLIATDKRPANISSGCDFRIIGVEEQSKSTSQNSAKDFNDLVFMVVSKSLPQFHDFETANKENPVSTIKKRYMVEDLGSKEDWDFNDIVIDVAEVSKIKYIVSGGVLSRTEKTRTAVATVTWLCGTLPMKVSFGQNTKVDIPKISDPTNEDQTKKELINNPDDKVTNPVYDGEGTIGWMPNISVDISASDWTPENNRITVSVWKDPSSQDKETNSWQSVFPKAGEVPYIIATDITVWWTKEGVNIDDSLWKRKADTSTNKKEEE